MTRRARVLSILVLVAGLPSSALAHARLVKSEPARRATLEVAPSAVRLWFNEPIEPSFARLSVTDEKGRAVDKGAAKVADDDPKQLRVDLPELAPGAYTVTYEVLSVDGHRVKQSFPFTVKSSQRGR